MELFEQATIVCTFIVDFQNRTTELTKMPPVLNTTYINTKYE